jgi:hypothetical protein
MSDERECLKLITDEPLSIKKPGEFKLDIFKSTRDPSIANVETLITALPHHKISEAEDWARLHPNEATYWSDELCFVNVSIIGQKRDTLHLITEKLAEHTICLAIASSASVWHSRPNSTTFSSCAMCRRENSTAARGCAAEKGTETSN